MAYPNLYGVAYSYTGFQQSQQGISAFPGTQLDADLAGLTSSIDGLAAFVERTIRSDGNLNNGIVTFESLSPSLQTAGIVGAAPWLTGQHYTAGAPVIENSSLYRCAIEHTSTVFATDLAAARWTFVANVLAGNAVFDSIAALEAATIADSIAVVRLNGYYTAGDGGMHWRKFHINGDVSSADGRKWRIYEIVPNVAMYGAQPGTGMSSGVRASNAIALQAAIDAVNGFGGGAVEIPSDTYEFSGGLTNTGSDDVLRGNSVASRLLFVDSGIAYSQLGNSNDLGIRDLTLEGTDPTATLIQFSEFQTANVNNVHVKGGGTHFEFTSRTSLVGGTFGIHINGGSSEDAAIRVFDVNPQGADVGLDQAIFVSDFNASGFAQFLRQTGRGNGVFLEAVWAERHIGATVGMFDIGHTDMFSWNGGYVEDDAIAPLFTVESLVRNLVLRSLNCELNVGGGTHLNATLLKAAANAESVRLEDVMISWAGTVGNVIDSGGSSVYARNVTFADGVAAWAWASTASPANFDVDFIRTRNATLTSGLNQVGVGRMAADLSNYAPGATGSGKVVLQNGGTLTAPFLSDATAHSMSFADAGTPGSGVALGATAIAVNSHGSINFDSGGGTYINSVLAISYLTGGISLQGVPLTPTAAVDTNTTQIASTAFVLAQASAVGDGTPMIDGTAARGTSTHFARADHVHPPDTSRAASASPALTGTPTAPTASVDTNTTQLATTAFVLGQAASVTPAMDGAATVGASTRYARADHVHASDTSRAALSANNTFVNGSGAPGQRVEFDSADVSPISINLQHLTISNLNTTAGNYANMMFTSKDTGGTERSGAGLMAVFSSKSGTMVQSDFAAYVRGSDGTVRFGYYINGSNAAIVLGSSAGASFPAIKPSSTTLAVRLGDDSADAPISAAAAIFSGAVSKKAGTVTLANGVNSNIAKPNSSYIRVSGPSASFAIGGLTGGTDGMEATIVNTLAQTMTITNEDASSTAGNRMKTLTGADVALRAGATSCAKFIYDATFSRWVLVSSN